MRFIVFLHQNFDIFSHRWRIREAKASDKNNIYFRFHPHIIKASEGEQYSEKEMSEIDDFYDKLRPDQVTDQFWRI